MKLTDEQRTRIRRIIEEWDPLANTPRHQPHPGEYDTLVSKIFAALEGEMSADVLAHHIHQQVEQMGTSLAKNAANEIVAKIDAAMRPSK